jgi:hypothetical protein
MLHKELIPVEEVGSSLAWVSKDKRTEQPLTVSSSAGGLEALLILLLSQ